MNFKVIEQIPKDRAVLVMPKDHSIRYGEMNLRKRRNAETNTAANSEIDIDHVKLLRIGLLKI